MSRFGDSMKISTAFLASAIICVTLPMTMATAADTPARWAYIEDNPNYKPPVDDGNLVRAPNSTAGYTWSQLRDQFIAPIWHPGNHPPLPDIVANGRRPDVYACGFCHRADGPGGPENADLAGLPKSYIIRQMAEYKSGARGTAVPGRVPPKLMIALSKPITDAEVEAAAAYFSALKPRKRIKVVESDTAPKTYIAAFLWAAVEGSEREPLGQRNRRNSRQSGAIREPRSAVDLHRVCAGRQLGERRGAGDDRWAGKDPRMRPVPRTGPQGARAIAEHRRTLTELHVSPAL